MTKQALTRILICLSVIAACIGVCSALDESISRNNQNTANNAELTELSPSEQQNEVLSLIEKDEFDVAKSAEAIFGLYVESALPEAFTHEAFDANDFAESYVSGETISLIFDGSTEEAQNFSTQELESKGWTALDGTDEITSNFFKTTGTYRWLVLQYLTLNDKTAIIVNATHPTTPENEGGYHAQ